MKAYDLKISHDWPNNLLYDISAKDFAPLLDGAKRPADFEGTLAYVLCSLTGEGFLPEARDIILMHYINNMSAEEIAEELELTPEDVVDSIQMTLRFLNQLFFKEILCLGIKAHTEYASSAAWRLGYQCGVSLDPTTARQSPDQDSTLVTPPEETLQVEPSTPIEVLSLSKRSINCLKRAGIHCVYDVISQSEANFANMPNCGKNTLIEVKSALKKYNLDFGCVSFSSAAL